MIPSVYLSNLVFLMLLQKAREEYGFKQIAGLMVPCIVDILEESLWFIECSQSTTGKCDLVNKNKMYSS